MSCFTDDLAVLNNSSEFETSYKDMYPSELELKKESNATQEGSFLDIYLKVSARQLSTKLLDKRDNSLPLK